MSRPALITGLATMIAPLAAEPVKSIAAGKFKDTCLQILDEVASTRSAVVITKRGQPVAKLVPVVEPRKKGLAGSVLKEVGDPFGTGEGWDADADTPCHARLGLVGRRHRALPWCRAGHQGPANPPVRPRGVSLVGRHP